MAGGKSERFWPFSEKTLFPFLGKPLVKHQIERIKKAGFKDLIVVCNQRNLPVVKNFGVETVLQKGEGQGAAILSAQELIKGPILIVNANDFFELSLFRKVLLAGQKRGIDGCLVGFKTSSYFPGGYLVLGKGERVEKIVEKPGEGKEPSDLVRIVVDFFKEGERFVQYLKKGILYEEAINETIKDGALVKAVSYKGKWGYLKYPWDVLLMMRFFLGRIRDKQIARDVKISKKALVLGPVVIEDGVQVWENAKILGPCFLGKGTIVGNNSLLRESMIGENCVIGFSTEVARSYVGQCCWCHSNYIGDSVLDKNVSLGAGAVLANLRLDEEGIYSVVKRERINTKRTKLGTIVGKNVRIGVNASLMPGVKVGKNSFIGPGVVLEEDLGESKFCLQRQNLRVTKNIKKISEEQREKFKKKISRALCQ